jgi:aminoglycoside phosphotransferase (APT) family kinase protein
VAGDGLALDVAAVERYLGAHLPGFRGPLTASKFGVGQSNPTYLLDSPSGRLVLRRKPPGQLLKSAHAVDREFRVQRALRDTDVPVPPMHLLCEDEGVIGSMFYLMGYAPGRSFNEPTLPDLSPGERGAVFDEMNRVLAALHSVDYKTVGLGDFGKPGSYFARQIGRWTKQYRASETGAIPDMDALIGWLEANQPEDDGRVSLVHGDYRLDNMIFAADGPRIAAVLDWELSTLGHPFSDLLQLLPHGGDYPGGEEAGAGRQRLEPRARRAHGALRAGLCHDGARGRGGAVRGPSAGAGLVCVHCTTS